MVTGRRVMAMMVLGWVMTRIVTARMTKMMMAMVVLVMKLTDSRPCSVPYGSGSVFNSTVRPELDEMNFLVQI